MSKVILFGREIKIKNKYCSLNNAEGEKINKPYINIYIKLTNSCNADCRFCCNKENCEKNINFDYYKFYFIISEISKKVRINKISFTGGEPTLLIDLLKKCVITVKGIDENIFTVVNTNGYKLKYLEDSIDYFDSIALSRHSYLDSENFEIFNAYNQLPDSNYIKNLSFKDKLHFSCILQKGYIDNIDKIKLYLEHASKLGVSDIGFVSLMPVNEYCKNAFIDFVDIDFNKLENLYISKEWNNCDKCRCRNYLYLPDSGNVDVIQIYTRYYVDPSYNNSILVFDGKNLTTGFNNDIII